MSSESLRKRKLLSLKRIVTRLSRYRQFTIVVEISRSSSHYVNAVTKHNRAAEIMVEIRIDLGNKRAARRLANGVTCNLVPDASCRRRYTRQTERKREGEREREREEDPAYTSIGLRR